MTEKQYIYQAGDISDFFFFQTKGVSAFVINTRETVFAIINPDKSVTHKSSKSRIFQYFGLEDIVINHTQLLIDLEDQRDIPVNGNNEKNMTRRVYNV
jgi:hypothetical protein